MKTYRLKNFSLTTKFIALLLVLLFVGNAWADSSDSEQYSVNTALGDGKGGRVWQQWKQNVANRPIDRVDISLHRQSGGNDTAVNLRFDGQSAFENGKKVTLNNNGNRIVSFRAGGAAPNGKPLVLNAYNGEVYVERVVVHYQPQQTPVASNTFSGSGTSSPRNSSANSNSNNSDSPEAVAQCREARVKRPRIEIDKVKASGGLFSGKYRINGTISGNCIEEAGYYEKGRLKQDFNIPLSDRFKRQTFSVQARSGRDGEIRVYSFDGGEDRIEIDEEIKGSGLL